MPQSLDLASLQCPDRGICRVFAAQATFHKDDQKLVIILAFAVPNQYAMGCLGIPGNCFGLGGGGRFDLSAK